MTIWRRSPRRVTMPLERLRDELAPATPLAEAQRVWPDVVGAAIAAEARPVSERAGTLTISCSASVWAHELGLMGPTIVERLNGLLGDARVSRLKCVTVPPRD